MIEIKVLRFDKQKDKKPYFKSFSVEKDKKMNIMDALNYINNEYNENISFRSSCRAGQCGSCSLKVNDEVELACKREVKNGDTITPLDFPVLKDLIVDKSEVDEKVAIMKLFLEDENYLKQEKEKSVEKINNKNKEKNPLIIPSVDCENTKKVRTCIECYSCLSACPVIKESANFAGPYFMRYISKFDFDPRDKEDRTTESIKSGLYNCTSCGKCGQVCPKNINSFSDAIEKLRALAYKKDLGPLDAHKAIKTTIMKAGRSIEPLGESFIREINKKKKNSKNKIAIFTGCMVDYRLQNVGFSLMDVLKENGIEADVPEEQVCCGSPLLRTGQIDIIPDIVRRNKRIFSDYDTIVTLCAGCGATLKNDYPNYGAKFNVLDISEFLVDKLNTDNMKPLDMVVTYHDPCHLIRGQGISKQPRDILNKIKGIDFVEMEKSDQCCGAGGGVKAGKPEIAEALAKKKALMIKKTDADKVVTICPFCQYNIQDGLNKEGLENIKVINILELLKESYN
ncbi:MAG: succinate dehydrogenase/fumarate reductase iron-sulfur subunit [Methanobrevibacter sp.]|jgi:fumarate reductase (CoM/CoB) subunit B|nr:succinate dehydrogenase/fumarate reductase iron-sulfur subunit [Candidatus Methanovirga meridionalis]